MQDEEGNLSMARLMLSIWTVYVLSTVLLSAIGVLDIPDPAYPVMGGTLLALIGWAAGPRIMKHIGGQIAGFASGISQAVTGGRIGGSRVSVEVGDLPQAKTPEVDDG